MKKIYNFLFFAVALFAIQPAARAAEPPYTEKNNIAYSKTVTGPENGIYTIHLDTFVTGEQSVVETSIPADIVLVLDVSGSMNTNMTTYKYTARESQGYSYNSYGYNNTYYYRHTDGQYYPVSRGGYMGLLIQIPYYLQVRIGGTDYYLSGTGITGTRPTNVTSESATIWTGVLYTRTSQTRTRLQALKDAVGEFVDEVQKNNDFMADKVTPRGTKLGNQIAIVKYANNSYYGSEESLEEGNHRGADDDSRYNYTEVVKQFKNLNDAGSAQELKNAVNAFQQGGATAADYGMRKAELLLNDLISRDPGRQSNKTVVLFTDGAPTYGSTFEDEVANYTIAKANTIKKIKAYKDGNKDVMTSVFTVGVFDNETTQIRTYMNKTSSNYPDATSMDDSSTGSDKGFYQNASTGDLSAIFRSIAAASGGSGATTVTAAAATTVDVVSQSFQMPEGATGDIHVYFAVCNGKDANGYLTFDEAHKIDNPPAPAEGEEDNGHVTITVDEDTQKITATGFDYSANWCGPDELSSTGFHGMKMMIEIPIEMADDAVGGTGVGTNGPGSGIWIDGIDNPLIEFESPHLNLPTNLHIKKDGIANGECATFEIFRKKLTPATSAWETTPYKTVIVIGGNNDNTVKLMGLDPTYLYKIVEKTSWSWSYDFDKITDSEGNSISSENEVTSDKLIVNPFIFVNKKPTDSRVNIRHAESAVYNDFRTTGHVEGIDSGSKKKLDPTPTPPSTPEEEK